MNIGTLEATLGVDTAGLAQAQVAMQQFQQKAEMSMNKVEETFDKAGRNIYYFGTASMRFLTLPLALAGVAAFKMASDFESSMQKIVGLVSVSQTQVNAWSKELLAMGPALGKSPKELADALYYITSSGIKGADAMNVLTNSAKASVAGLGETKDVANAVTSAMNAYSKSNLTSGHTLDILTAAVREGKAEGADFARQIGDVVPIASQMGVSFDQVAAGMAAMTLTGISTAESATYLKNMLFAIEKNTPQTRKALQSMGTSIQELRNSIANKGLLPTLENLRVLTNKYGEDMMSKVFPNIRAFMGVLSLMGDRLDANKVLFQKVANSTGDMNAAYLTAANTLKVLFGRALAQVMSSAIELGLALKGPIKGFLQGFANTIKDVSNWILSLSKTQQKWVLGIAIAVIAIGPLAIGIGLLMRTFAGIAIVIKAVIPIIQAFNLAILANPVGALAIVLSVAIASMIAFSGATTKATNSQKVLNDEIERGKELAKSKVSIDEQMKVIGSLSQLQLQTLKETIEAQLKLEDTYNATLLGKLGENSFKVMSYKKGSEAAQYDIEKQANLNRIKLLSEFLATIESKLKTTTRRQSITPIDPKEMERVSKFILAQLKIQEDVIRKVGQDYDTFVSKISKGGKTQSSMTIKTPKVEFDTNAIDNYRKHFMFMETNLSTPMGTLQKKLADIALQNGLLGDSFDPVGVKLQTVGAQIAFVKQRMQEMLDQGIRPGNDATLSMGLTLSKYIEKLRELEIIQRKANLQAKIGSEVQSLYDASINGSIKTVGDFANALRTAIIKIIAMYVAEAVTVQVANAMKSSKNPWLGLILGAAAGAATYALFNSIIPKFAEGGQVPGGYPNDTYPALLTSGETVIPPHKLSEVMDEQKNYTFEIRGDVLVAILKKQGIKNNLI
jgi:TP901 family phage tail tape measure protein